MVTSASIFYTLLCDVLHESVGTDGQWLCPAQMSFSCRTALLPECCEAQGTARTTYDDEKAHNIVDPNVVPSYSCLPAPLSHFDYEIPVTGYQDITGHGREGLVG